MACCSGATQTRKFDCVLTFRPDPDRELPCAFTCPGQDGRWVIRINQSFYFGDPLMFGSGDDPPLGQQSLRIRFDFVCAELSDGTATISATLTITLARQTHRGQIKAVPLMCINGGPTCTAVWDQIYLGENLGVCKLELVGS